MRRVIEKRVGERKVEIIIIIQNLFIPTPWFEVINDFVTMVSLPALIQCRQ